MSATLKKCILVCFKGFYCPCKDYNLLSVSFAIIQTLHKVTLFSKMVQIYKLSSSTYFVNSALTKSTLRIITYL